MNDDPTVDPIEDDTEERSAADTGQRLRQLIEAETAAQALGQDDDIEDEDEDEDWHHLAAAGDADQAGRAIGHAVEVLAAAIRPDDAPELAGAVLAASSGLVVACMEASGQDGMPCPTCGMGLVPVAYMPHPQLTRCEGCRGLGRVLTGSLVAERESELCPSCNGQGFQRSVELPVPVREVLEARLPDPPAEGAEPVRPLDPASLLTPGPRSTVEG